jgi:uncharacterized protein (UPF0303 family)
LNIADDIQRISEQERRLVWVRFDLDRAWQLGSRLRELALTQELALTIEVRLAVETVFFCAMPGVTPANADWARRKRNTVELLHRSSYGVGRTLEQDGQTLLGTMGLAPRDYASHGGSFPIRAMHAGVVGTATVSGAPQRVDHNIVVRAIAELCGVPVDEIALS